MPTRKRKRRRRRRRRGVRRVLLRSAVLVCVGVLAVAAFGWLRSEKPPRQTRDLCALFAEKRDWHRSMRDSARRYGVPEAVQMAILHQESRFRATARAPRRRILWVIPGPRTSTAYGYAQVLDGTWRDYRTRTGRPDAKRTRFDDVAHFVGWYASEIHRIAGIEKDDAYNLYLAYHEGPSGYRRGSHRSKAWLLDVARRVERQAARYQQQLAACDGDLAPRLRWPIAVVALALLLAAWILRRRLVAG